MTRIKSLAAYALATVAVALAACGKDQSQDAKAFDTAFVAAEADKGNLVPLKELSKACHREVLKHGRRRDACEALDQAGKLQKRIDTRF